MIILVFALIFVFLFLYVGFCELMAAKNFAFFSILGVTISSLLLPVNLLLDILESSLDIELELMNQWD